MQLFEKSDSLSILTDDDWGWLASMTRDWWPSKSDTAVTNGGHKYGDDDEWDDNDKDNVDYDVDGDNDDDNVYEIMSQQSAEERQTL